MKVSDFMTKQVVTVDPAESVQVAARILTHYNIGALPVCGEDGNLQGIITDRDIVIRCLATCQDPTKTKVGQIMTRGATAVKPTLEASVATHLMGKKQIRRLPVMEDGKLCGIVSLGDFAKLEDSCPDAADALADISHNVR